VIAARGDFVANLSQEKFVVTPFPAAADVKICCSTAMASRRARPDVRFSVGAQSHPKGELQSGQGMSNGDNHQLIVKPREEQGVERATVKPFHNLGRGRGQGQGLIF